MLTDSAIRAAKPKIDQTVKLSDGGGLQLWVQPSGSKLWNLAYRFAGKQRKLAIGSYPGIGLKEARAKREEAKKLLASGFDPSQQKRLVKLASENQRADTFEAISREVLEKKRREGRSEATVSKAEWLFGLATPALGSRPVAEITAPEVLTVLRQVEAAGQLETARRLRAIIGQAFRYAIATGRAVSDPTSALRGALTAPVVQHRAAIVEPVPFGALLRAIDGYDGTSEVRIALQLLALTFTRPGELRLAAWKEFDLDARVHEDASPASHPAGAASDRHPGRASHVHRAIRIALSRRALTLAAAIGKHAQRGAPTAWIRQRRHVQPWVQGGGLFASQRMQQVECRRHRSAACACRGERGTKGLCPR